VLTGFDVQAIQSSLKAATYPSHANPMQMNIGMVLVLLIALVLFKTMVYGPLAATLEEPFLARIRYPPCRSCTMWASVGLEGCFQP